MQTFKNYTTVFWVFLLLQLAACSQTPVARDATTGAAASRHPSPPPAVTLNDSSRRTVLVTARNMLGAPYRYGGAAPGGFDCSGLVLYSHRNAGIRVPRTAWQQHQLARQRVALRDLTAGDLLFFKIGGGRSYHVGIYAGDGTFIHAPSSGGRVTRTRLDNSYWNKRLIGAGNYY